MTFTFDELKLARERGYSDDEIWNTLSTEDEEIGLAKERGYSLEEVASITSGQPIPEGFAAQPEPEQPFFALEDAVSAIGTIPEALAVGVPAAFKRLVTGTAMPEESETIERDLAFQERMQREQEDRQAAGKSSVVGEAIREAAPSLGFTVGSGGSAVAGGFLGLLGGPAAKVTVPAGIATASGIASYRMAASDLLYRSFRELEKSKGSPLTDEEKAKAYEVFLPLAQESGLWEAGPEAVSNVLLAGAGKFIFGFGKPVADRIVKDSIGRVTNQLGKKVAAGTGALAGELAGETTTAVGQFPAQAKAEQFIRTGTTEGAPTEYPGGVKQAFKDVAPSTIALTVGLAGAGGAVRGAMIPFQRPKTPEQIEEDNINLDAEREADNLLIPDTDEESKSIKAQIDSERADLVVKKELYNSLPDGDKAKAVLATEIKEYEGRITALDNTLRQRLGLSVTIKPLEKKQTIEITQEQIDKAAQDYIATPEGARAILENKPFDASQSKRLPDGWFTEAYEGKFFAIPPAIVKIRMPAQAELRKLSILERAALAGQLSDEKIVNNTDAKTYILEAKKQGFTTEEINAATPEARAKWDQRFGVAGNARTVAGEVSPPSVDFAAEEAARARKPKVTGGNALPANKIFGKTAREALQYLADQNLGASELEREGRPLNISQIMQRAASVIAKLPLRILDADFIKSAAGGNRAYRSSEGFIRIPATSRGRTYFERPETLVHEVGHTLTADAIRKYVFAGTKTGQSGDRYLRLMNAALDDANTPEQIKKLISLYKKAIDELGLTNDYFGANGLASTDATSSQKKAFSRKKPLINKFTGKKIGWSELYALANLDEFVAQAWSSPAFQDLLKSIKVKNEPSIFEQFVRIIRDLFGFESDTMAAAVIDASFALAELEAPATRGTVEERIAANIAREKEKKAPKAPTPAEPKKMAETARDADYLAAVERGDMETAQRMVDEAARAVGYNVGPVWHGTPRRASQSVEEIIRDAKQGNTAGAIPFRSFDTTGQIEPGAFFGPIEDAKLYRRGMGAVAAFYLKDPEMRGGEWIVRDSTQIKSADPVTYDDAGNVIPLSQRFQPSKPDIRMAPKEQPAPEKPITDPATPDEQTQQLVQQAQEQESIVDAAVKEAGEDVFNVFNKLVNEGKTEEQVSQELGISKFEVRKLKLRADTAILNKMKQKKVQPLAFQPKNPVVDFAEKNAKKYFTKEGWLPKMVYQSWVKRNATLSREQKEAEYAIKDLYDGIRKVFGISKMEMITKGLVSVPPDFVQQLNDALAGQIDINTMPEPVREPLTRMRQHVDTMSRQLVALNVLPDDLAAKISDNLGVYLTRSYKIFTDKNWINKIPQEKLNNARNFLYKQQLKSDPTATIEMADRELRNMLNDWASEAEGLRKRGGKLGAKDLSVMMKRAEVPKVLREVMGENMNVVFNYANTIGKISRFLADQRFLNEVKAKGTGQFLFTAADAPQGFNTQIAAEESRTMSPLNGLRTTPEIAKAFEEFGKGYDARENPALYALGWLNAVGKLNLTVGSILTQMRNMLGQPAFFVFNGHYNWAVIRQEIDAIAKDKGISKEDAKRELIKQAAAQGLVNENAYAGELRTAFQEVGLETFDDAGPDEFVKEFVLTRMFKQGVRSAQDLYQKTDEFGKLVGWLNETKRIQRMNKGMDKATAQSIAAERTRDTYPTYSQSSEALRLFRRQPFIGPFATFFYETFRTSFHNLRYAFEDMKGPTPEHRAEGRKRLAGAMAQLSAGAFAVNLISQALSNIGDDEEEDVRRMLPPWAKDASILWMPKSKDGTYNFINLSYINPYNALTDPFIAMMSGFAKGEKPEEIATQAFGSFLSPFVDEQPVSAAIVDAMRNRTETGKQVYNPQDDIATKTSKIMLHIFGKTFTPGTLARLNQRIIPAIEGETVGTRAPAPVREVTAELTGIRFETLDMKAAFSNKAWEFSKAANESERIFRDIATRRRRVNEQEQIDAYRRSEQTRYEIWNEMYRDYMAVRRAGASQSEAVRLMTDIGISKKEAQAIARGRYTPYEISDEVKRRSKLNGNTVPLTQIKAIGREMPKVLTDIPAE